MLRMWGLAIALFHVIVGAAGPGFDLWLFRNNLDARDGFGIF